MTNQHGVTLVEMMVYLAIAAMISVLSVATIQGYRLQQEIHSSKNVVEGMRHALQSYYYSHCNDTVFVNPTVSLVVSEGMLWDNLPPRLKSGSNFNVSINRSASPPSYQFSSTIDSTANALHFASALGADSVSGSVLTWRGAITSEYAFENINFVEFKRFYSNSGGC